MNIKDKLIIKIAKFSKFLLKLTNHKATSLPGKIAYNLDNDILDALSENTKFIFVTGTNGKTMTTHFVTNILRKHYKNVFTNDSGSNMIQGIITVLLDIPKNENALAILEVDEANLVRISKFLKPDYVILTNIFRDQMDRFGEIYNVYKKIMDGLQNIADAVRRFAGANVKDYGGIGGLKTVSVRSLGATHTAVAYDGVAVSNTQAGQIDIGRFALDDIDMLSLSVCLPPSYFTSVSSYLFHE